MRGQTRYANSGEVNVAYQVAGSGTLDLVYVPGWVSHVEYAWEHPASARFLQRLASFSRLILFDKRGTGMSDRVATEDLPTLEERMDDVRAVMDEVGSERAALFGWSEGGNLAALFAATYPDRVEALVLFGSFAKRIRTPDYPWAPSHEAREEFFELIRTRWGGTVDLGDLAPSALGDAAFESWWAAYLRNGASPGAALALARMNTEIDIRGVLPAINVPTLVLHRAGDRDADIDGARFLAGQIPDARFVELEGDDHLPFVGDAESALDEIEEFLTGTRRHAEIDRVLATVLFTDIVGSTEWATKLGDRAWGDLVRAHHATVRRQLMRFRGTEVDTAGDGFFASFDGPARAVRCAVAIAEAVRELDIDLRIGIHTGECELVDGKVAGLAVNIGARVAAAAASNEILVSSTVKDLVAGSGIAFTDRGLRSLKGVPGEWHLWAVQGPGVATAPDSLQS